VNPIVAFTVDQGKRLLEMLRWWESTGRIKTPEGRWTPFQNPTTASGSSATGALTPLTTIGSNTEGSETADSGTWTRSDHAVEVWVISRVVYNQSGDQILYSYARKFTYDTLGALYSISAETRITVDVTGSCP
jgi:hypothetical protein